MKQEIVNATPPTEYAVCTSESCSERSHCLHAVIAPEVIGTARIVRQINAQHPNYREGATCDYYRSNKPEQYARGFAKAMNELSRKNYATLMHHLIAKVTKTHFYRMKRGEVPLSPADQKRITALLRAYGYEGDTPFDRYEMRYTW